MSTYEFVLFLHLFFVILAFTLAGLGHMNMIETRKANTVAQIRPLASRLHAVEPMFPISAIALFAAGAYLVQDGVWSWSDPWIVTSIVGLLIMEIIGGAYLARATKRLNTLVSAADLTGPIPAEVDRIRFSAPVWIASHFGSGLAVGIVFLMTVKPGLAGSLIGLTAFGLVGAASALPFVGPVRERSAATTSARQPL